MYLFGWFGPLSEDAGDVLQYLFVETFFNPIDLAFIVPLVTGGIIVLTICLFVVFSLLPSGTTSLLRFLVSMLYLPVIFQFAYVVYQHHDEHSRIDLPKYKDDAKE